MRLACIALIFLLTGCAANAQRISVGARQMALACEADKAKGTSGWRIYQDCSRAADVPLPPDCMVSDDAARTSRCATIAQSEALGSGITTAAQVGVNYGLAVAP